MSIEDEIRAKKEKMQADMREEEQKKQEAERLLTALRNAGMHRSSPVLIVPAIPRLFDLCRTGVLS